MRSAIIIRAYVLRCYIDDLGLAWFRSTDREKSELSVEVVEARRAVVKAEEKLRSVFTHTHFEKSVSAPILDSYQLTLIPHSLATLLARAKII